MARPVAMLMGEPAKVSKPRRFHSQPPLPNRLRELRWARGLALEDVRLAVGLRDKGYLSRIELGQQSATDALKVALAQFYGLPVEAIFDFSAAVGVADNAISTTQ